MKAAALYAVMLIPLTFFAQSQALLADDVNSVMIVSGHVEKPLAPPNTHGALSFSGKHEYLFNDALVNLFTLPSNQLADVSYTVVPATRNLDLKARSRLANVRQPDLYIEIHHDSAKQIDRDRAEAEGPTSTLWRSIRGFSVHFSSKTEKSVDGEKFAVILASAMRSNGFSPNHYLADRVGMRLVDRESGLYDRIKPYGLYIFRAIKHPAVVLEVGNIANPEEEKRFSRVDTQQALVEIINNAVATYFSDQHMDEN